MPLTLAETPLYYKDSQGQYHRIMSGADMTGYRTAAAQDAIDAAQDAEIAKLSSAIKVYDLSYTGISVTAGQSVSQQYSFPVINGWSRAFVSVHGVSGSGTGRAIITIHGNPSSGYVWIGATDTAVTANFTIRCLYVRNELYENVTPT